MSWVSSQHCRGEGNELSGLWFEEFAIWLRKRHLLNSLHFLVGCGAFAQSSLPAGHSELDWSVCAVLRSFLLFFYLARKRFRALLSHFKVQWMRGSDRRAFFGWENRCPFNKILAFNPAPEAARNSQANAKWNASRDENGQDELLFQAIRVWDLIGKGCAVGDTWWPRNRRVLTVGFDSTTSFKPFQPWRSPINSAKPPHVPISEESTSTQSPDWSGERSCAILQSYYVACHWTQARIVLKVV